MTTQTTTHSARVEARIAEAVAPIMSRNGKEYVVEDEALAVLEPLEAIEDIARDLAAKLDAVLDELEPDREPPYMEDGAEAKAEYEFRCKTWQRIRAVLEGE